MKCPSCNGYGWLRGFHACARCRGKGVLFPRFIGEDEVPADASRDLAWCLVAVLLAVAGGLAFLFL